MLSYSERLRKIISNGSLCPSITTDRCITSINIDYNNIGDEGCEVLAAALPQCPSIASIDLGGNRIGDEGCKALAAAFPQCPSITSSYRTRR